MGNANIGGTTARLSLPARRIGARLKALRFERALGLRETARRANMDAAHLAHIEAGERMPTFATVRKIANGLGVDVRVVLDIVVDNC